MSKRDRESSSKGKKNSHLSSGKSSKKKADTKVVAAVEAAAKQLARKNAHYVDLARVQYIMCTPPTATDNVVLIATMAQGVGVTQRVGKHAAYKSIQLRGSLVTRGTGVPDDSCALIVYDREPTGILPQVTDILQGNDCYSFLNDVNSERFRIIRRLNFTSCGNAATPTTGREIQDIEEYIDMRSMPVVFKAAGTGAIGDIAKGALYLVWTGTGANTVNTPAMNLGIRTRFMDVQG